MSIPDVPSILHPLLHCLRDGKPHKNWDLQRNIERHFQMTEEEKQLPVASGQMPLIKNRVSWALTYLKKALLIERVAPGTHQITERGQQALKQGGNIDNNFLKQYAEFRDFFFRKPKDISAEVSEQQTMHTGEETPDAQINKAETILRDLLIDDLLQRIKNSPPEFFERLILDLLKAMGYGEPIVKTRGGADGGIDGTMKQDKLGLETVCIQAKRWEGTVGRPIIQGFVGALLGKSKKGVFVTTSDFTQEARSYAENLNHDTKVVLIDGHRLAELMIDHSVGVSDKQIIVIKRIDNDYFDDES